MADRLILHEDPRSGNCYKIKLTGALLGVEIESRQYDILKGETRTPEFLQTINAHGRIPVLQIGERFLPESNAACWFLAEGSSLVPDDAFGRAQMLRWMFFEQYSHEPNIATLRFWHRFVGIENLSDAQMAQIEGKRSAGQDALKTMDEHLRDREWFAGSAASLADIALFAYSHVSEEADFDLANYPAVRRWIEQVPKLPGFIPMG
ncbi:MAG: glutathione S-transferase family protein [Pseudomonadota bacterium]